ncbi:MAG: hypothetical protein L0Z73_08440 [Gammaproteobacteria bacterium]|nr:hypothetical protein [Gammaproteobacteria bacterium]
MLETNGIPPRLAGRECEALICQQYWQDGRLVNGVDVLYIKTNGRWHQLYFENCTIFWRAQTEAPVPHEAQRDDPFKYPLVDLGHEYRVNGEVIASCDAAPIVNGVKVTLAFEMGNKVIVTCIGNVTGIQYIKTY